MFRPNTKLKYIMQIILLIKKEKLC